MVTLDKVKFTMISPDRKNARKYQSNIENDNVRHRNVQSRYSSFAERAILSSLLEDLHFLASESKAGLEKEQNGTITKLRLDRMILGRKKEIISQKELFGGKKSVKDAIIIDHYGDRGKYSGAISKGEPNGYGMMIYDDGRYYKGDWHDGKFHNKGEMSYSTGDIYTGGYKLDLMHGVGKYVWRDGRVYEGDFSNDRRHGNGTYSWPDGSFYIGSFRTGDMHGYGSFTFPCGTKYNGEFRNGHQHGHGELLNEGRKVYDGSFSKGLKHGFGTEFFSNGDVRHRGLWNHGQPL